MRLSFAARRLGGLAVVAGALLLASGCGGGEEAIPPATATPEPSPTATAMATARPAPSPSPSPSATSAPTSEAPPATATPSPVATPTEVATPTTAASPAATPSPTPSPTVPAAPTPSAQSEGAVREHWQPEIREVATDYEALGRVQYAPGEPIGIRIGVESGLFFLSVETGAVEGWVSGHSGATRFYSPSPGNRYVFRQGLLHERAAGRTFEWDPPLVLHVPGLVVQSGIAPVEGTQGLNEHVIFSKESQYAVVNPTMEAVAWFELDDPVGSGSQWWADPNGDHLLLRANHGVYSISLWEGSWKKIEFPPVGNVHIQILDGGQGFILSFSRWDWSNCRIAAYSWAGRVLSSVLVPCIPLGSSRIDISPDGKFVATLTRVVPEVHAGRGARKGDYYYYSNLMVTSLFDATTGEELLHAKGVAPSHGAFDIHHGRSSWLADNSGLVVNTRGSTRVLGVDGSWASLFPFGLMLPAPDNPARFDRPSYLGTFGHDDCAKLLTEPKSQGSWCFLPTATVVGSDGQVIAALRGTLQLDSAEAAVSICCNRTSWGLTSGELRLHLDEREAWVGLLEQPVLSPQIELPPFEDRLLLQVATTGPCLHLREAPLTASASLNCLPARSLVEVAPAPDDSADQREVRWRDGLSVVRSPSGCAAGHEGDHACYWLHVRTEEGLEGWMLSDFLIWKP